VTQQPEQQVARGEALDRAVNEAIERGRWPGEDDARTAYRCECGRPGCNELAELTPRDYEDVRSHARWFIVVPGHERPDVEVIVRATPRYVVVEKRDDAGRLADATDPRE
jgi:hypothetical protein